MQKVITEINLKAITDNALAFQRQTKKKLCAVVKANAYGHGAEQVVNALSGVADCFAVAIVEEAVRIKTAACGKDILVLTPPMDREEAWLILQNGFIACVPDLRCAKLLVSLSKELGKRARIHIKVNTGMNRYGTDIRNLGKICKYLKNAGVEIEGVFSHLYLHEAEAAEKQRQLFLRMISVCKRYFSAFISHLSATYGATLGESFAFDMVRVGLGIYGYLPDDISEKERKERELGLEKAMRLKAKVVASKAYSGGGLGYQEGESSKKERAKAEGISVIRFGYADGGTRLGKGISGGLDVIGNLCMDATLAFGRLKKGAYVDVMTDAYQTAKAMGTIAYETLCNATKRAEIVYIYE